MSWLRKQNVCAAILVCLAVGCGVMAVNAEVKKNTAIPAAEKSPAQETATIETATSQQQVKKTRQRSFPALTKRELKIQEALGEETDCTFFDQPLSEVMDFFSETHDIPILIFGNDLGEEGLTVEEPVNISIEKIALRDTLELILEPIGLTYIVEHGVVKITTSIKASEKLTSRVYPVGDLCRTVEDYLTLESALRNADFGEWRSRKSVCAPEQTAAQTQQAASHGPAGGGFFSIPGGNFKGGESIDPLLYENGAGGTITMVQQSKALVITQTYHAHNAIVDLLTQIREAKATE